MDRFPETGKEVEPEGCFQVIPAELHHDGLLFLQTPSVAVLCCWNKPVLFSDKMILYESSASCPKSRKGGAKRVSSLINSDLGACNEMKSDLFVVEYTVQSAEVGFIDY